MKPMFIFIMCRNCYKVVHRTSFRDVDLLCLKGKCKNCGKTLYVYPHGTYMENKKL